MVQRLEKTLEELDSMRRYWEEKLYYEMLEDNPCKAYVYYIYGRLDTIRELVAILEKELKEVRLDELYVRIGKNRKSNKDCR